MRAAGPEVLGTTPSPPAVPFNGLLCVSKVSQLIKGGELGARLNRNLTQACERIVSRLRLDHSRRGNLQVQTWISSAADAVSCGSKRRHAND